MPRIQFITTCATDRMCFAQGQIHDLSAAEAAAMLRAGYAIALASQVQLSEPPQPEPKPKRAKA